ncbi:hypothetical protein UFOVP410_14 [uncultured Caudovirales phage]|uniref:Uncharacterized protein n=1 Tax=uncultured Caudovirales phage TaxID=2100421 RepID=A0A6J5M2M2_9CAUD|nr:hypothetical protein UFOVP410_14 [uncultured Caudovirales phage]
MKKNNEKSLIKTALIAISKGNSALLKDSIKKALLSKVRRKINKKEKVMAKKILNDATKSKE